ncbi:sensor histidine kinase [Spirillospora sp. CA-294931]|uniref:sensor histidine kinase n=1 Tax=Spirillospora sp. CA-294931 TaxID=3240042 RepID=UPI003D91468F
MRIRRSLREWGRDIMVAALAGALGLLMLEGAESSYSGGDSSEVIWNLAIWLVSLVVLVLFRRQKPVHVSLLMSVLAWFASTPWGMAALSAFTVAVHRSWRMSVIVGVPNVAIIVLVFTFGPIEDGTRLSSTLVMLLGYAVFVAAGMLVRSRRMLIESLKERAVAAEEGQRLRVEEARLLERERIAREMHDVLAHRISLLAVHAGALEFHGDAPDAQREAAGVIRRSAHQAMEDLREVIWVLRDDTQGDDHERPQPTLTDLPALVEQSRQAGAHVTLDERVPDPATVPDGIGRHAYRIVQEALTNARKHAPGAHVRITVDFPGSAGLAIEVVNSLPPGPALAIPGAGAGLVGLRERAELVGGTLEHGVTGGLFRLYAWLPVPVEKGS